MQRIAKGSSKEGYHKEKNDLKNEAKRGAEWDCFGKMSTLSQCEKMEKQTT